MIAYSNISASITNYQHGGIMEAMGIDLKYERGLTISTRNMVRRKDLIKNLHKAIARTTGISVDAIVVGECLKGVSQYSNHYHIVFSRDLSEDEKERITEIINNDDRFEGEKRIKTKWGIYNNNGYIFTSEDHQYWNKVKIY